MERRVICVQLLALLVGKPISIPDQTESENITIDFQSKKNSVHLVSCVDLSPPDAACLPGFGDYMNCIKTTISGGYDALETEYQSEFNTRVDKCFAKTIDDSNSLGLCKLGEDERQVDAFGVEGPLQRCKLCIQIASFLKKGFIERPKDQLQCIRDVLRESITEELRPCIYEKLGGEFEFPTVPDFDEFIGEPCDPTEEVDELRPYSGDCPRRRLMNTTSAEIVASYRIEICRRKFEDRHLNTKACMNTERQVLDQHCQSLAQCTDDHVTTDCVESFVGAETTTCKCGTEIKDRFLHVAKWMRGQLHKIATKDQDVIAEYSALTPCGGNIKPETCACKNLVVQKLQSEQSDVNWLQVAERISGCMELNYELDKLIVTGCDLAVSRGEAGIRNMMITLDFIVKLIEALNSRVRRFCAESCPM